MSRYIEMFGRNAMRTLYTAWQTISSVALTCAANGITVAIVTLAILVWNSCRPGSAVTSQF